MEQTFLRLNNTGGGGGDKPVAEKEAHYGKSRTSLDTTADVRDILSNLVGRGISDLSDEGTRAQYQALQKLVGQQKAGKLLTQVLAHNSRSAKEPMEKRIQSFYEIGSNDPETNEELKKVKSFGYGVLPGFRESVLYGNQVLTGRLPQAEMAAANNSDLQKKVMLRLQ